MKTYTVFTVLVVLLMLTVSMSAFAQVQEKNLVGWWLFDDETEETGNWGDITLRGATLENGQMVCTRNNWANAFDYEGPDITELTLVSWVSLDDLDHRHGSALTLDRTDVDQFCGIVYAEKTVRQWMSGSSHWRRTDDFPNAVNENKIGEMVRIVITYKIVNNGYEVTGYRDDKNLGTYNVNKDGNKMDTKIWKEGNAEAIWGARHSTGTTESVGDSITAHIEESRIYNVALTEKEVMSLEIDALAVEARGKLTTRWAKIKRQ